MLTCAHLKHNSDFHFRPCHSKPESRPTVLFNNNFKFGLGTQNICPDVRGQIHWAMFLHVQS